MAATSQVLRHRVLQALHSRTLLDTNLTSSLFHSSQIRPLFPLSIVEASTSRSRSFEATCFIFARHNFQNSSSTSFNFFNRATQFSNCAPGRLPVLLPPLATANEGIITDASASVINDNSSPETEFNSTIRFLNVAGELADSFMEALLCFGCISCTVEDANANNPGEEEIYVEPWTQVKQERRLWKQSTITAVFPSHTNILLSVSLASASLGWSEEDIPQFERVERTEGEESTDWVQQVKDSYRPIQVEENLWVVPAWLKPEHPDAINILLEPGLAFGTGEHPTTRLCLSRVVQLVESGMSMLDFGTGSGILAIAAHKVGAAETLGVDIDPLSIRSARYNASVNEIPNRTFQLRLIDSRTKIEIPAGEAEFPGGRSENEEAEDERVVSLACLGNLDFDVVVANVLLNPLLEKCETICGFAKKGGVVCVSGIISEQIQTICDKYSRFLTELKVQELEGWAVVWGKKL